MGLASLLKMMWADEYVDEKDARFINDRVHANIQRDGTFSVVPQMKGGVTTPAQLRRIADVAEKYDVPMVKLTGGQRIDLLGIRKEDLPEVWADLGHAVRVRLRQELPHREDLCRVRSSAGSGSATRPRWASRSKSGFQGLESPAKMKLAVTGCPRNCAEALRQGPRRGRHRRRPLGDLRRRRGRRAHPQGRPAGHGRHAGEVITLTGRFMQYYRENANWLERTYAFVPRIGHRADPGGHRRRQPRASPPSWTPRMQASVDAYRDPWQEGAEPADARPVPHLAAAGGAAAGRRSGAE